ncbi:hypothetical protein OKW50_000099 [Paraburkholderia youngii]|uniref:hypothetical protein n=1 Tax=Paraburkholderia youngii TaxID=2782701 RepID=UPI003D228A7E
MSRNNTGNGNGLPTIAWLDPVDRARLAELCTGYDAIPERLAGQLLADAIRAHVRGQQRLAVKRTETEPVAGQVRKAASRSTLSASERARLKESFEDKTTGIRLKESFGDRTKGISKRGRS